MEIFEGGETATIWARITHPLTGNPYDPASVTVEIKKGGVAVDSGVMVRESEGVYFYYYNTTGVGIYTYYITATDEGRNSISKDNFKVE